MSRKLKVAFGLLGGSLAAGLIASAPASGQAGKEPHKIAVLMSTTGPLSVLGIPEKAGIDIAAEDINAAGGVKGRRIELLNADEQSDPSKGVIAFKRLVDQKPAILIGPTFSSTALALIPLVEKENLPMISLGADDAQVRPLRKQVFLPAMTSQLTATAALSYMQKKGLRRIAVIRDTSAYGAGSTAILGERLASHNVEIVQTETFNMSDTAMTTQLTKIKNNPAVQGVLIWAFGAPAAILAREVDALGFTIPTVMTSIADPNFYKAAGAAADNRPFPATKANLYQYLLANDPSRKLLDKFVATYKQRFGEEPKQYAAVGYDAMLAAAKALEAAQGEDSASIISALDKLKFTGVNGNYAWGENGHAGPSISSIAMAVWKDGKILPEAVNCEGCFASQRP
jgi:branched-chain amino acid transport system substrate-binding protein